VDPAPAVEPVARSFWARPESEDYRETVPRNEVGAHFLMHVAPRIETPAEGPWTIAFVGPSGRELARFEGMRVDVATGHFTFLCATDRFAPGDWTVVLRVEEGGLSGGARRRTFRFHVE
jgi:hypothetical protein